MSNLSEFIRLHVILPTAELFKGTCATKWYKRIVAMQSWSREQIIEWQEEHLHDFIRHAYDHTQYYHHLFDTLGLKPEDIQCAEDLKKLPILTKEDILIHHNELIPDNLSAMRYRDACTGGTTGTPMHYYCSEDVWGYVTGAKIYSWKQTNYHYGDKFVALGSSSLFQKKPSLTRRIYDWIRREIPMNCINLSEQLCAQYLERMRKEHIHFLYGYASAVFLMAKYAHDYNLDVSFIKGVFTTSENLTDTYRNMIEKTFHCRVMDCYGAQDAGIVAFEIRSGKYDVGYDIIPEVVDEFGDGEGSLVTTSFLNYAFPLIRYKLGDNVCLQLEDSDYNAAVITKIYGRDSNVLRLDNGHVLTSPGFTILMDMFDVVAYDVQKISGTEIKMVIQPIPDKWTKTAEEKLSVEMQRFVGGGCKFSIEYVDHFEPLKNGKRRYFMSDLSK